MTTDVRRIVLTTGLSLCTLALAAQEGKPGNVTAGGETPVYRVKAVSRTVKAISYSHRNGPTEVNFLGTSLMPDGSGEATIESKAGRLEIKADFRNLLNANSYGPEYLTYVLWAVTPEGRPVNLGEIIPNSRHEFHIHVTSKLQAFGLMVTAEPYFAATVPSNMTVLENSMRPEARGWEQLINARYNATEKGEYTVDLSRNQLPAEKTSAEERTKIPLALLEARNAVAIAQASGAQKYAPDVLAHAKQLLNEGDEEFRKDRSAWEVGTAARGATEVAEDARVLSIRRKADEQLAADRKAAEEGVKQAQQPSTEQNGNPGTMAAPAPPAAMAAPASSEPEQPAPAANSPEQR